jgi:hypothetical protein
MKDAFYFVADPGDGASRPPRWHTICRQTKLIAVDLTGAFHLIWRRTFGQ